MLDLSALEQPIAQMCRELNVVRLDLFGSATRLDFAVHSDVDVLVVFDESADGLFKRYFTLKERLEQLFGRPVDLVTESSIRNPYFRAEVDRSRVPLYDRAKQEASL